MLTGLKKYLTKHVGMKVSALVFLLGFGAPTGLLANTEKAPEDLLADSAPLERLAELVPARIGTDRQGYLWSWDRESSTVELFSLDGTRAWSLEVPVPRSLAVDRVWGVAATATDGSTLEIVRPDGTTKSLPLSSEGAHVAWLEPSTLAVSTARAAGGIEIWEVDQGRLLRSIGFAREIVPRVGAVLLRSVVLEYSPVEKTLFALDSVGGRLDLWTLDGRLKHSTAIPAHRKASIEKWLEAADRRSRELDQRHTPFYEVLRLAVDSAGSAWTVERCSPDRSRVSLIKISDDGNQQSLELELPRPCCSNNFTIWNDHFVSVLSASTESTGCAVWRRLP